MPDGILERAGTSDHPITVESAAGRVTLKAGETVLAQSDKALILREGNYPPVYYMPKDSVTEGSLTQVEKTTHCPYKGDATYWDFALPDDRSADAAVWSYETPIPGMASIQGHIAFYADRLGASFDPVAV